MGELAALPMHEADLDRAQGIGGANVLRRRWHGEYPIDPFGADPQLQDLLAPLVTRLAPVRVRGTEHIPEHGPALFVSNRGSGILEPTALSVAVRQERGRRLRVVGAPEIPVIGDLLRKFGSISSYPGDLGAVLRAGHLAVLPLGLTWLRTGGGLAPTDVLVAALGHPVIPVLVRPGGPLGLPVTPWKVTIGEAIRIGVVGDRDPLSAAELAEAVREAVQALA